MIGRLRERFATAVLEPALAPLKARYDTLQPREQLLVGVAAVMIVVGLIHSGLWQPLQRWHRALESQRDAARAVATRLAQAEVDLRFSAPRARAVSGAGMSVLSAVDQAAKNGTLGKPPARLQPDGEQSARIWLEDTRFDAALRWMYELETRYGMTLDVVDIERREAPGTVNARISVLRKP